MDKTSTGTTRSRVIRDRTRAAASARHVRTTLPRPRDFPPPTSGHDAPGFRPAPAAPPLSDSASLLERHPLGSRVTVTHEHSITGDVAEQLWQSYVDNVAPLSEVAVLKHLDTKGEVLAQFANPRIRKIVAWQGGAPIALGMVTNSLEDVAEISPQFLRARYPELAARDAIYVGMLVMVSKAVRGMTVFSRIYTELWQVPARARGVLVFDVCEFNRVNFGVDVLAERIADNFPHASVEMLDRQTWYVAHLPEPIPERTTR